MSQQRIEGDPAVAEMLVVLRTAAERTQRDLDVAFSLFSRFHQLPTGTQLLGTEGAAVLVNRPEP